MIIVLTLKLGTKERIRRDYQFAIDLNPPILSVIFHIRSAVKHLDSSILSNSAGLIYFKKKKKYGGGREHGESRRFYDNKDRKY